MAGQGSQISDHETRESSGSVTVNDQNAVYRAPIPRTTHELYVSTDYVSQEPRSARTLNTTYQIADGDECYEENYTFSNPGIETIVHGLDTLALGAALESDDTNGSDGKREASINTQTTRTDKITSSRSAKDRLSGKKTLTSVFQLQAPKKHRTLADRRQSGRSSQQTESDTDVKYDPEEKAQKACINRLEDRPSSLVEVADPHHLEITLDIESNPSSLSPPSQTVKDKLDIRVLDQAAQKRSYALGVGSSSSDDDANQINTPTSSTGASDQDPQNPYFLLDGSNTLIRSAAGLSNGSKKNPRQSSNTGRTSGRARGQGGSEGIENRPTENRENEDLEGDSEEDEKDDPNSTKKRKRIGTGGRKFACPFFKHDPEFHTTSEEDILRYRSCVLGPGWPSIARLKEHIRRVHKVPITCLRCQKIFDKQDDLVSHQREAAECKIQPISPSNRRMTAAKEEELKKKHQGTKYNDVYGILFPNEPYPLSPYYLDGSVNSFQDFALEKMLLLLETQLDHVIANYPTLDGAQKMSLKNDMKIVATLCQKQILEEYKKGISNTAASYVSSETDKDFDSMDTGLSPAVANFLPPPKDPSSSNWPPGSQHPVGLSLAPMTKSSGTMDSSSSGPQSLGPQTPNNPRTLMSVNGGPFRGPYTSSSSSLAAQSGSEVVSIASDDFVAADYEYHDPSLFAACKSQLYPHGSVFPNGSPIPRRIFKTPYSRTRNKTSSTQPSLRPGMETRQRVPSQPQYPSNAYGQASKDHFNTNHAMISPSAQTPYVQMPQNVQFQPQFPENSYNHGLGDQYGTLANPPPSAMGHMATSQNAAFPPPVPEDYFFPDPNFDTYPYYPPNSQR